MNLTPLPIDPLLPEILGSLEKHNAAIVTAEPGAGKTTRVPPALMSLSHVGDKEIWVLQPRRLGAKLAAARVAEELGEELGQRVGYQFRFEKRLGTRLRFMTDGMLFPLAQADPVLSKTGVVILDEFHERSLALELGLAFLRRLQLGPRLDLRLVVMSATLDAGALSGYLSGCPVFKSSGRVFPVEVEHHPFPEQPDLSGKVRNAVRLLLGREKGTTLVFLPGLGEIKRCQQALRDMESRAPSSEPLEVRPLYGDMTVEEQQQALRPSEGNKVILATNVAETSLTVPGVTAVVDSGLTRQARVSAWSGLESLVTVLASQASAAQRAGRAGRLRAGLCLRLYSKYDWEHRAAFDAPEISRADLSKSLLDLLQLGVEDLDAFPWFLKPAPAALDAARLLLRRLGAVDPGGRLTSLGRRMARFPLPPRLAKLLLEVEELAPGDPEVLRSARRLAVLISEERAESVDLLGELAKFKPGFESKRLEEQLAGWMGGGKTDAIPKPGAAPREGILAKGLLAAFPDRVGRVRITEGSEGRDKSGRTRELLLSTGGTVLADDSALTRQHEYFVVVEAQETASAGKTRVKARSLCPIEVDWLLDLFPEDLVEEQTCQWNAKAARVEGFKRLRYDQLMLDEKPLAPRDLGPEAEALLLKQALSAGPAAYCDAEELEAFLNRVRFVAGRSGGFPEVPEEKVRETLALLCKGCRSLEDLRAAGLVAALKGGLAHKDQALLERLAPGHVTLAGGRRVAVHYESGKPPWIESRLQDFFGMRRGPAVAEGEVPVVLHLLSPAKRAVQITGDLAGFWENHYPQIRKELMRKYPRHKWPENPI